ncbi:ECF RNA polymerase sigma factor SigK [Gordonia sp. (in: high G+C Gram-positive bacteria)]|uniref:ECF RNA polymerase sigma factor SigK n=1 Tax=Gordonia TaxID=2053 RepID=UPI003C790969
MTAVLATARLSIDDILASAGAPPVTAETEQLGRLLLATADGDRAAFADFYDRTSARVFGMVVRVLRDEGYSEEVTQEVYLQVWRDAGGFRTEQGSAMSWLLTIAHRRAVDRVRSESSAAARDTRYGLRDLVEVNAGVEDEVTAREESRRARHCLGTLTALQAEAVTLAYYDGLTYREVAQQLSVALPTIKSRIRDGLKRLRGCLAGE